MTTSITNNGDGTSTLSINFTADSTKIQSTADDAMRFMWNSGKGERTETGGLIDYESLTLNQKLAFMSIVMKDTIISWASAQHRMEAERAAKLTATEEATNLYNL